MSCLVIICNRFIPFVGTGGRGGWCCWSQSQLSPGKGRVLPGQVARSSQGPQEQLGAQCLAEGHFDMQLSSARDRMNWTATFRSLANLLCPLSYRIYTQCISEDLDDCYGPSNEVTVTVPFSCFHLFCFSRLGVIWTAMKPIHLCSRTPMESPPNIKSGRLWERVALERWWDVWIRKPSRLWQ